MADVVDELQIEINAKATKANDSIDRLVGKLDRLTTSLSRVNGTNLNGLANGVQRLGNAMQVMNTIKTADFTRLATNLTKLGSVNVSALNSAASSMSQLTRAFNSLGTVSANAQSVGEMAKNISKLGNKSVQTAITNIPQLAKAMNNLMATLSKSPKVSKNVIQMTNALANLASQGSKVGSASNSIVRGLNKTSTSANTARKSFGGLASAIGKFYAKYFMVIRGLKGLWSSIESTADYIEAYNYFNVSLGKIGSDWSHQFEQYGYDNAESYAESFSTRLSEKLSKLSGLQVTLGADGKGLLTESGMKNLGLNIQEITQYASQLASVTNSIGQTGEVSLATASSFTKLAGDISSLFNVDYSSVAKNLQSGLIGQSRALYKYGIDITNATLQTYAYNLGLSKSVSEMTQAEKMQLRMLAILDQSKVSWGDLANTINSPSNMIRQFTNNLKETGMVLGQLFVPILQKVLPIVNGVTIAIKRLLESIAGLFGIKIDFDAFGQGYSDLEDGLGGVSDSFDDVASSAKKAKSGLRAFDELKTINIPDASGSGAGGVGGGGIDLTDEILKATEEYEKAWQEAFDKMENKAQEWADKIDKLLEPVKKIFKDFAIGDFFQAGQDVSNLVVSITDFFARAIDNVDWYGIGQKIGDFLAGIDWTSILSSVGNMIWQGIKAAFELWAGSFDKAPLETIIGTVFAGLSISGISLLPLAKTLVSSLMSQIPTALSELLGAESLGSLFEGLSISAPQIVAIVAALVALTAAIVDAWNTSQLFRDSVINTFNNVKSKVVDAFEKINEKINPLVESIKKLASSFYDFYVNSHLQDLVAVILTFGQYLWGLNANLYIDILNQSLSLIITQLIGIIDIATGVLKILDGIITLDFSKIGEGFQTFATGFFEAIMGKTPDEFAEQIVDFFTKINWNEIIGNILIWVQKITVGLNVELFNILLEILADLSDAIAESFNNIGMFGIAGFFDGISDNLRTSVSWIRTTFDNLFIKPIKDFFGIHSPSTLFAEIGMFIIEGLKNGIYSSLTNIINVFKQIPILFYSNVVNPIINNVTLLKNNVSIIFYTLLNYIKTIWINIPGWFSDNIIKPISNLFNSVKNTIVNAFSIAKNLIIGIWSTVARWFNDNVISPTTNAFKIACDNISGFFNALFYGIKKGIASSINAIIASVESGLNRLVKGINDIITGFNRVVSWASKIADVDWTGISTLQTVSISRIQTYATGGFPEDGWFRASHGEIMGQFDNGKSVVANNNQITEGISAAVYRGNQENNSLMRQEIALLQKQNELLLGILEKDTGISKNDIGMAAQSWARDYSRRTGREAYSF